MTSKRQRTFTRRSRAGCRTCRLRHVKCDETPVACKNCKAAGWKCDGYDENRLAHPGRGKRDAKPKIELSLSVQRLSTPLPGSNSDERRGFAYFQQWTAPRMNNFFDTCLWHQLVLPMSHEEQAVAHAVVALSALHEDVERRGTPLSRDDLRNPRQRFALEQYTRAISYLNMRRHSNDPKLREVLLTCCLLFIVYELLRGQYDTAFVHLHQGLSIVKELRESGKSKLLITSSSSSASDVETPLMEAMARLRLQSIFFGVNVAGPEMDLSKATANEDDGFQTVLEARTCLDKTFQKMSRFLHAAVQLNFNQESANISRQEIQELQGELRVKLSSYMGRLRRSKAKLLRASGKKDQRAIDLIHLHHKTLVLLLETYIEKDDRICDMYMDEFRQLVELSERVANSFADESDADNRSRPTLLLDMGIIPSLLYVCLKCPDTALRQQALKQMRAWPHREGPWDSNLIAIMASLVFEVEIEAEYQKRLAMGSASSIQDITYISASSRTDNASLEVSDDQKTAVLKYNVRTQGNELVHKEKSIKLDHVLPNSEK